MTSVDTAWHVCLNASLLCFYTSCMFHRPLLNLASLPTNLCNRKKKKTCLLLDVLMCVNAVFQQWKLRFLTFRKLPHCEPLFSSSKLAFFTLKKKWSLVRCLIATALFTSWALVTTRSVVSFARFWAEKCCPCRLCLQFVKTSCQRACSLDSLGCAQKRLRNLSGRCKVYATDCFEKLLAVKVLSALYSAFSTTLPL